MARVKVTNDDNVVLIDDNYVNLCMLSKQTVRVSGSVDSGYTEIVRMPIRYPSGAITPMLVINSSIWHCVYGYQNGTWWVAFAPGSSGQMFEYMVFDIPRVALPGTGLMVLRNAAGEVTFDSDGNYMRCKDIVFAPYRAPLTATVFPSNRKYGVGHIGSTFVRQYTQIPGGLTQIYMQYYGFRVAGNTVYSGLFAEYNRALVDPFAPSLTGSSNGAALVIDVTNY